MRFPLNILPSVITSVVEARVSMQRINKFLLGKELDPQAVLRLSAFSNDDDIALAIKGMLIVAVFNHLYANQTIQTAISIGAETKRFCTESICALNADRSSQSSGKSAQVIFLLIIYYILIMRTDLARLGKSSLLSAFLGEMPKNKGSVEIRGSVAYVPQQPWIQNATVKNNILFGRPFDSKRFKAAVKTCELTPDFAMLPAAEETEIGEKGSLIFYYDSHSYALNIK